MMFSYSLFLRDPFEARVWEWERLMNISDILRIESMEKEMASEVTSIMKGRKPEVQEVFW